MGTLSGQAAIVTGGAQGIGRAVVEALARDGASILIADVQEERAAQTARDIAQQLDVGASSIKTDITSENDCEAVAATCLERYGRIDILVNVAGGALFLGYERKPLDETTEEDFRRVVDLNLHAAFLVARATVPSMKKRGYGRIVFISSVAGRTRSRSGIHAYAAGKAGVLGLMRDMAYELGAFGITVNSVAPGFIESNPRARAVWDNMEPAARHAFEAELAIKRPGKPEEIAAAVRYFASPDASYTTGQTLIVDGGKVAY
jgi:3-oxoacyl-[acyl-carrier protein] reductase